MSFLGKLKDMFSGEGGKDADEGLYLYVRLDRSDEIVRLRLNPSHELNVDYERSGFVCRKHIIGPRSFKRAEATFYFDEGRRLVNAEITGGELATEEEWLAAQPADDTPGT